MSASYIPYIPPPPGPPEHYTLHRAKSSFLAKKPYLVRAVGDENYYQRALEPGVLEKSMTVRRAFISKFGFSVYSDESLVMLSESLSSLGGPALEVGAGSGYLSVSLNKRGLECHALDKGNESCSRYGISRVLRRDFEKNVEEVDFSAYSSILMAWPEYTGPMSEIVIDKMTKGQTLVYIGEDCGGCTATDEFFGKIQDTSQWVFHREVSAALNQHHYTFMTIHDAFYVYSKI